MADRVREPGPSKAELVSWRRWMLEEAGYPQEEAFLLAKRLDIDLHVACKLLRDGCSLKTAIKILT